MFIPCQRCGEEYDQKWSGWFVCDTCGYRICHKCLGEQGFKCEECTFGYMQKKK